MAVTMRAAAAWLVGLVLALWMAGTADARPGGGHTYSSGGGGGGSYSSSGGGGGGSYSGGGSSGSGRELTDDEAAFFAALLGLVIMALIIVWVVNMLGPARASFELTGSRPVSRTDIQPLVRMDPDFSQVVFEDFVFQLFARAHRARDKPDQLALLTPYLGPGVISMITGSSPVDRVVIGSLRITGLTATDHGSTIVVRIEANLAGPTVTTNVVEGWTFSRAAGVKTRPPEATRTFPCPNCNAPFALAADRTCAHCGTEIAAGRFDWTATNVSVGAISQVGITLTGTVAEVGNDLPTLVAPDAFATATALYHADSNITRDALFARLRMIYEQLNAAWNAQDLVFARGLVTHSLLGYLQFWIDEYKRQRLANRLEGATIHHIALAKVVRDPYFDAITLRVYADGHDFTVDAGGNVVGGSRTTRRAYTEYWTLIRSATRRGPIITEPKCPNCGAPLAISDVGDCTHCNAHVENGSVDWVLSKIEQDEVYTG